MDDHGRKLSPMYVLSTGSFLEQVSYALNRTANEGNVAHHSSRFEQKASLASIQGVDRPRNTFMASLPRRRTQALICQTIGVLVFFTLLFRITFGNGRHSFHSPDVVAHTTADPPLTVPSPPKPGPPVYAPKLPYDPSLQGELDHLKKLESWTKPHSLKVVALVFYGRSRFVSILDCYLQVRKFTAEARFPTYYPTLTEMCRET